MRERFEVFVSILFLCSYFVQRSIRCENIADSCQNGQIGCKISVKNGDDTSKTNVSNSSNVSSSFIPSASPFSFNDTKTLHQQNVTDSRARAINFTSAFQDDVKSNGLETGLPPPPPPSSSSAHKTNQPSPMAAAASKTKDTSNFRIDNVSMDDDDDDDDVKNNRDEFNLANFSAPIWRGGGGGGSSGSSDGGDIASSLFSAFHEAMAENTATAAAAAMKKNGTATMATTTAGTCVDRDKVYKVGEKFNRGCDESCQCLKDGVVCSQLCKPPYQAKGRNKSTQCTEEPINGNTCCVKLTCGPTVNVSDLETEPMEDCVYKNTTYKQGSTINDGCEAVCICEAGGRVSCKSRCPPVQNATENCVTLSDQRDPCCKVVLCDVEEHDVNKIGGITGIDDTGIMSSTVDNHIMTAKALNDTSVVFTFSEKSKDCNIESTVNGVDWETTVCRDNIVTGLQAGKKYQFRLKNVASNKVEVVLPSSLGAATNQTSLSNSCLYKGKTRKIGEEFHDGCTAFCVCEKTGVDCAPIDCPTDFGLDVLDPQCVDWETFPPDFVPTPPHCCPEKVNCRSNGSCLYEGKMFPNWSELPSSVTGCEKTCYCEMGNVTCQSNCPQISNTPPNTLRCPPEQAVLTRSTGENCCPTWICPTVAGRNDEIIIKVLEPIDENTIKLVFSVPSFMVGLHGRIELRYTSDQQNNEPSTWEQQILAPPNDLIRTKELEFELGGLNPNTTYKIKISVMMHHLENAPSSSILTIKTPPATIPMTTLPPIIPVEPELRAIDVNSTYVKVAWRIFTDMELQFIDGVQLRYKEIDDKIYSATPLIHRAVTTYTIEELKSDSVYEIGIFFIPFPGQTTELQAHRTIQIRTSIENDPYKFDVTMDVHHIKSTSIEISWSGVPYPEDKFVHIFRAIYQSEGSREDVSSFKAAKRDSPQSILIQELKPGTRYRLWLEVYLTNGRTKKSNVKDFVTKLGPSSAPSTSQGKLEGMALMESSSYYGPLVAVSIFATIATTSTIILLLVLAKKHGTNKAPITSPINRKNNSSAAYDNPSYKTYENDRNGCNNPKTGSIALSVFPKTHIEKEA